ncbi:MAG: RidA family protein [Planctomycetota bacterium]
MTTKIIDTPKAPKAIGPYVQAVEASGRMLFVSGQIPLDPATGNVVPGGIEAQAEQVFKNALAIVEAAGGSAKSIVKNGIFLTDLSSFAKVNEIYAKFFGAHPPARFCVQVTKLPKDVLIEMDSVACLG